jgi:NitT/TauT family transport system ATP-binding protein
MISLSNVSLKYPTPQNGQLTVLKNLNINIAAGEFFSVIGPSGCGKTTLLRLLAGFLPPTAGKLRIRENELDVSKIHNLSSFVFQRPVLFSWRTVMQNILLPLEVMPKKYLEERGIFDWKERAKELLELVGLQDYASSYPHQLSGGMQARVALARAYITSPELLLMDEPFASLDYLSREKMNLELLRLKERFRSTIVFVTHSIEESVFLSDRVLSMPALPSCKGYDIYQIDLPSPRELQLRDSSLFTNYTRRLREKMLGDLHGID